MKILIFGNLGYVGSVLTSFLKKNLDGCLLYGYDNGYFAHCLSDTDYAPEIFLDKQYYGDIRNIDEDILHDIDVVVFLSAISNDPMGNQFKKVTYDINELASIEIANIAKRKGVKKFIFASSCSMYGNTSDGIKVEDDTLQPLTPYAQTKVAMEKALQNLCDNSFHATALRFATACGFSPRVRLDLVLNDFLTSAYVNKKIELLSDGTSFRPLIHVKDMSRAILWAVSYEHSSPFLAVNAGSDDWNFQIKELALEVQKHIDNVEVLFSKNENKDNRSYQVSFERFQQLAPNHQPKITLQEAISEFLDGLEKMQFANKDFRNSQWIRLKTLDTHIQKKYLNKELQWTHDMSKQGESR